MSYSDFWNEPTSDRAGSRFVGRNQLAWIVPSNNPCLFLLYARFSGNSFRVSVNLIVTDGTIQVRILNLSCTQVPDGYLIEEYKVLKLGARNTQRFLWTFQRMGLISYHEVVT